MGLHDLFLFFRRGTGRAAPAAPAAAVDVSPASQISRLEDEKRPITLGAVAFIALIACVMVCLEGLSRYHAYHNELEEAQVATVNITRAAAEHAEKTVDQVDSILFGIVERIDSDGLAAGPQVRLQRLLAAHVEKTPALQALSIYDARGNRVLSSDGLARNVMNNADRAYFTYHRDAPDATDATIHLGKPVRSRSSNTWVLPMSRRLQDANGRFAGVALATVPIQYFQDYYNDFELGRNGAMVLALTDGTLITRRPFVASAIGSDILKGPIFTLMRQFGQSGTGLQVARLDHVERQYSFMTLARFPLVASAALSKEDIFALWWTQTWREVAVVTLLIAFLGFFGFRLFRQILIRESMEHELRRMHLQLEESVTALDRLARTDALTGLSNRRCLDERLATELARAARASAPLALIMIDIDYFKRYNDSYGHLAGDACLQRVGAAIDAATRRPGDLAARFGGEEFAMLLPNTDIDGAMAVARRICAAVLALQEHHRASDYGIVTISAGVTACMPGPDLTPDALFADADQALYGAKSAGRNQAMAAGPRAA